MKVLVVDDHVLIREALRGVLRELKGGAILGLRVGELLSLRWADVNQTATRLGRNQRRAPFAFDAARVWEGGPADV